jgi:hypothetical protein
MFPAAQVAVALYFIAVVCTFTAPAFMFTRWYPPKGDFRLSHD